ncbi:MAG: hypothetical protein AAF191_01370 [Verrucomicrobiota bacterium]
MSPSGDDDASSSKVDPEFALLLSSPPFTRVLVWEETYLLRGVAFLQGGYVATIEDRTSGQVFQVTEQEPHGPSGLQLLAFLPESSKTPLSVQFRCHGETFALGLPLPRFDPGVLRALPLAFLAQAKSARSQEATEIDFQNRSPGTVSVYWIDWKGDKKLYRTLKPGSRYTQSTYRDHVWVIEDEGGRAINLYSSNRKSASAAIR